MTSVLRRYSKEEFARRGDAIYERDVRPRLQPDDEGKFIAVDIETSAYEIDLDELTACERLRARIPDAQIWLVCVGSRHVHRFGRRELPTCSRRRVEYSADDRYGHVEWPRVENSGSNRRLSPHRSTGRNSSLLIR